MNQLAARLRERIAASGPISFSVFMEAALYDPEGGFYARGARLGAHGGAFTTAPISAPFLARALGSDLRELWERDFQPTSAAIGEPNTSQGFEEIEPHLEPAAGRIETMRINGSARDALCYHDHPDGLTVIAVGGLRPDWLTDSGKRSDAVRLLLVHHTAATVPFLAAWFLLPSDARSSPLWVGLVWLAIVRPPSALWRRITRGK